jgi:hypothetical protein
VKELIERIKEAYILETDAQVAEFLDLNPSTLSMQKNRGRLNLELIIEKCSDLNKNWLLEGKGPIWNNELESDATRIPVYSSFNFRDKNKLNLQNSVKEGSILIDTSEEWDYLSSPDHLIGYTIGDDAMAPTLQKHDIAFFDLKNRTPNHETIFLIAFNHKIICRRIQVNSGSYIISGNDDEEYSEISQNNDNYNIIGEIICVLRRT